MQNRLAGSHVSARVERKGLRWKTRFAVSDRVVVAHRLCGGVYRCVMMPLDCNLLVSPVYSAPVRRELAVDGSALVSNLFVGDTLHEEGEPTEDELVAKLLRAASPEDLQALLRALHIGVVCLLWRVGLQ